MISDVPNDTTKGRPRDDVLRTAILDAALEIARETGFADLSIDAIAKRAGASRPTLYRWWPTKGAILLDALMSRTKAAAQYGQSDDLVEDLVQHARGYARLLNGKEGGVYRAVFAEGLRDPEFMAQVREQLIEPRRAVTRLRLNKAVEHGQISKATNLEALTDALYAPFIYRLILGHHRIDGPFCVAIVEIATMGVLVHDQ
jgi:AcrR family transcriptional regulator